MDYFIKLNLIINCNNIITQIIAHIIKYLKKAKGYKIKNFIKNNI